MTQGPKEPSRNFLFDKEVTPHYLPIIFFFNARVTKCKKCISNGGKGPKRLRFKVLVARSHSLLVFIQYLHSYTTHSFITFVEFRSSFIIAVRSGRGPPLGCRAEMRTRGRRATNCATLHPTQLSHSAPYATEPRRTLNWATLTLTEPRRTLTEPRCTLTESRRTHARLRLLQ